MARSQDGRFLATRGHSDDAMPNVRLSHSKALPRCTALFVMLQETDRSAATPACAADGLSLR
jgi:hypothetical protein